MKNGVGKILIIFAFVASGVLLFVDPVMGQVGKQAV